MHYLANGGWSPWSPWSACSAACGSGGSRSRTRSCNNPPPETPARTCTGSPTETQPCFMGLCKDVCVSKWRPNHDGEGPVEEEYFQGDGLTDQCKSMSGAKGITMDMAGTGKCYCEVGMDRTHRSDDRKTAFLIEQESPCYRKSCQLSRIKSLVTYLYL